MVDHAPPSTDRATSREAGARAESTRATADDRPPLDLARLLGRPSAPPWPGPPDAVRRTASVAQTSTILALQQTVGNLAAQRLLARAALARQPASSTPIAVRRQPMPADAGGASATAAAGSPTNQQQWDQLVQAEVEAVLHEFQHIPVNVTWTDNGKTIVELVEVSPPYFINREGDRKSTAETNRANAGRDDRALLNRIGRKPEEGGIASGNVLVGKSTPEELRQVLQAAVDAGRVKPPANSGRTHPNAEDLRAWLVKYGIGVDCSLFVSQAINRVLAKAPGLAPLDIYGRNAASLAGGQGEFDQVARPDQIRPGDTMHHPGHIRIVSSVRTTAEGVEVTTAESSSVGDVGPTANVWLLPNPAHFANLKRERRPRQEPPNRWEPVTGDPGSPTFGRHRALAAHQAGHTTGGAAVGAATPGAAGVQRRALAPGEGRSLDAKRGEAVRRAWSDAPADSPNAAGHLGGTRRIPIQGLKLGNQDPSAKMPRKNAEGKVVTDAQGNPIMDPLPTDESAAGRAIAVIPYSVDPAQPVEVLLHFHGHNIGYRQRNEGAHEVRDVAVDRIEQQVRASGRPMIGVLPQGTAGSGFGPAFDSDAYIIEVLAALVAMGELESEPVVSRIVISGHSGGGRQIADLLSGTGQARVSAGLGGVVLFDAINGDGQLQVVKTWVLKQLTHDLTELTKAGSTAEERSGYLDHSMRFRAFHSRSEYYGPPHEQLRQAIAGWFAAHKGALDGAGPDIAQRLRDNYQVIATASAHDKMVGDDDHLQKALAGLPPVASSE